MRMPIIVLEEPKIPVIIGGKERQYSLDHVPPECPVCHRACMAYYHNNFVHFDKDRTRMQIVLQCPSTNCSRVFIASYEAAHAITTTELTTFYFVDSVPFTPIEHDFGDEIRTTSPSFVEIFNEAEAAESYGLKQICGAGYRKALEFLVKDYLISVLKIPAETVEGKYLGNCVKDHLAGTKIAISAERAAWLGNDESHYVRLWADKDLNDLKKLIRLTVSWMQTELLTASYEASMTTRNSKEKKS